MRLRRQNLLLASLLLLTLTPAAHAHRIDEYLHATILSVSPTTLHATLRLVPGVLISAQTIAAIDRNHDNTFSPEEQRVYATAILNQLRLSIDNHSAIPTLTALHFPSPAELQTGNAAIQLDYTASLPATPGPHTLTLTQQPLFTPSVYLVNALVPDDPAITLGPQTRDPLQTTYQLSWQLAPATSSGQPTPLLTRLRESSAAALFHLGLRHIAEGTDHVLFLLALLLPAPLAAASSRWAQALPIRQSLLRILAIVTAFTLGHSLTLALATFHLVRAPSRPIEILIAASILLSALHALRPLLARREAAIAAFFGLIHGLAFAATLSTLGLDRWQRALGLLAFNAGIELMQLAIVLAILPSLLLLSRTRLYTPFRIAAASFAALAATGWLLNRAFSLSLPVDPAVDTLARHAPALAAALFALALITRLLATSQLIPPRLSSIR